MAQSTGENHKHFPTTHWSLVAEAGHSSGDAKRRALTQLIERYLPALRRHLLVAKRYPADDVDDLLQCFLAEKILAQNLIRRAEQHRGKFRNFLLATLEHYCSNRRRYYTAAIRNPGKQVSLDATNDVAHRSVNVTEAFDIAWAREVLAQAVNLMKAECKASGRLDIWGVFEGRVLKPTLHQDEPVPYPELVSRFKFVSPAQASNALVTANRQFTRALRQVVGVYERGEKFIDEEIADLRRILASSKAGN